jgi:hypothetical protein
MAKLGNNVIKKHSISSELAQKMVDEAVAKATLRYEAGVIVAEGDFVIVHGRFSGFGAPVNWIAADVVRIEDSVLVEHWDVIQDEASEEQSKSNAPMFGDTFPTS